MFLFCYEEGTRNMLNQWVCRRFIERLEDDKFRLITEKSDK